MDNLTHTLTGLMIARCGFNRFTPGAAAVGMLAANAPDIDIVSGLSSSIAYLDKHRGITHGLVIAPLLAILPLIVARYVIRLRIRWLAAYPLALIGVLSHLLLDWTNVYGTRLLLPFDGSFMRLDITHVVDPWIWAALILSVAAPALARLVSSEIGARPQTGRGWAIFAISFLLIYDYGRWIAHERAIALMQGRLYGGAAPRRVTAVPNIINPFAWTGVVEGSDFVSIHRVNLLSEFDPTVGSRSWIPEASPPLEAARRDPVFQGLMRFSQLPFWRLTPIPDGWKVELMDLRFGPPSAPRFTVSGNVDPALQVHGARFQF
jgi:inner membrane protein